MLEASGDGKHGDDGKRLDEDNDIIIAAVIEEVVPKGARDAGDKQIVRWAEVVDGDRSTVADEVAIAAVDMEVVLEGAGPLLATSRQSMG